MGMRVSTNIAAINAHRNLRNSQAAIRNNFAQMASGSRINKSSDDAAGLAISENLKSQIRSLRMANRNANDGMGMVQTAEGGLNEIGAIIVRLREISIQGASDTIGSMEKSFLDKEVQQLKLEIERISKVTTWGEAKLLDGSMPVYDFQVGIFNNDFEDRISFDSSGNSATLSDLGLESLHTIDKEGAQGALGLLDEGSGASQWYPSKPWSSSKSIDVYHGKSQCH
jgi:flagellin